MMKTIDDFLTIVKENPGLPVIPMVNEEIVRDFCASWWMGAFGRSEINEIYIGRERVHFKDDDEESVLVDMEGCKYSRTKDGTNIYDLSDEEWKKEFESLPWKKVIAVYIGVPVTAFDEADKAKSEDKE